MAVYEALSSPYRGQNFGPAAMKILAFFDEEARLGEQISTRNTPSKYTVKAVKTRLTLKADRKVFKEYAAKRIQL